FLDSDDLLVAHLDILMQICRAAHFAHARGILHRDIKPANVIVGDFGEVCLLDWGIAVEMSASARAEDAELSGSPAYMAPEMLSRNTAGLSPATDVYLLGGCLYELLAGQPPHVGDDPEEVVQSVMRSSPPFPENAPPELVAIARRALSPKPAHRYPSANALRQAVMQYLDHRESIALSDEASRHLVELTTTKDTEEPAHHARLLRRFGACRFGFSQALRRWPENEAARRGLVDAYEVMIAHEADHANADAAAALLDELADHGDVPRSLVATVEQARRRATEQAERMAALERLGRMFDPNHQLRTRWIVTSAIALLGTVFPIASQPFVDPHSNDYAATFIYPVAFLALVLGLIWNKRHAVARNAYHRWLAVTLVAGLTSQLGIVAVGAVMQLPIVGASAFVAFGWALATGIFAATTERRAAPIPLAYLAVCFAIALSATDRRHANYLTALGHLAAAITVFVIWRPGRSEGHGGSMALDPSPPSDPSQ
ncbi:MAG: serine/threonine-protein kinase, partial [Polyangiaceae bacterium]